MDIYYCMSCGEEFAVKKDKEPEFCPFCTKEIGYSHTTEQEETV